MYINKYVSHLRYVEYICPKSHDLQSSNSSDAISSVAIRKYFGWYSFPSIPYTHTHQSSHSIRKSEGERSDVSFVLLLLVLFIRPTSGMKEINIFFLVVLGSLSFFVPERKQSKKHAAVKRNCKKCTYMYFEIIFHQRFKIAG